MQFVDLIYGMIAFVEKCYYFFATHKKCHILIWAKCIVERLHSTQDDKSDKTTSSSDQI